MRQAVLALLAGLFSWTASGQSTEGLIAGRVLDRSTGKALQHAVVVARCADPRIERQASTNDRGFYYLPQLPPGQYQLSVRIDSYQTRELYELNLTVAGYLQVDFELRPASDIWERGRYRSAIFRNESVLTFFGPDIDPAYSGNFEPERAAIGQIEPSVSEVISPGLIASLPLSGRDAFTAVVLLPGVASDTSTVRSIGLSVNGQRPTSSAFLLDGVDNNNHVVTGPLSALAPEAIQEYRVSTNNFSSEYGGVTGYIANAITRSGGPVWHGTLYANWKDAVLGGNSFEHNANGIPRTPYDEIQPGFSVGGPLPWRHWELSSAYEYFHAHSTAEPRDYFLPTQQFLNSLTPGSFARGLLEKNPPRVWATSAGDSGIVSIAQPVELTRSNLLERADYNWSEKHRIMLRGTAAELTNPNFTWTPYGQSPFKQNTVGGAVTASSIWTPSFTTELRIGLHRDRLGWGLVNANIPGFVIPGGPQLPGTCCGKAYEDRSLSTSVDFNSVLVVGKSLLKVGTGWTGTRMRTQFAAEPQGIFYFANKDAFKLNQPFLFESIISRVAQLSGSYVPASLTGRYARHDTHSYVQEDFRATPNLTLNAGVRLEYFGAPVSDSGVQTTYVPVFRGAVVTGGQNPLVSGSGGPVLDLRSLTWAGRLGAAYSPNWGKHKLMIRAGYGTFHEGMFDNLWSGLTINDAEIAGFNTPACPMTPGSGSPVSGQCFSGSSDFLNLTTFASPMKIPTVQSFFASTQFQVRGWTAEVNGLGSSARHLFSTDVVNRSGIGGRPIAQLPDIYYRANDARSHYAALTASARYQSSWVTLRLFYTWAHSIDNQSDPLLGDFFDLGFSNQTDRSSKRYYGAFTLPGNFDSDIGNSDFDQRHNFTALSFWNLPGLKSGVLRRVTEKWVVSQTFAVRSGLPYSVFAGDQNCHPICNTRADLINRAVLYNPAPSSVPGIQNILSPAAFAAPAAGRNGNTGRNAFPGPGFWNFDLSISRVIPVTERMRAVLRADAYNLFNHANLQTPDAYWGIDKSFQNGNFGAASFGRTQKAGFPALTPLTEGAREVQILVRLQF